jgi:hypothetical protein
MSVCLRRLIMWAHAFIWRRTTHGELRLHHDLLLGVRDLIRHFPSSGSTVRSGESRSISGGRCHEMQHYSVKVV